MCLVEHPQRHNHLYIYSVRLGFRGFSIFHTYKINQIILNRDKKGDITIQNIYIPYSFLDIFGNTPQVMETGIRCDAASQPACSQYLFIYLFIYLERFSEKCTNHRTTALTVRMGVFLNHKPMIVQ